MATSSYSSDALIAFETGDIDLEAKEVSGDVAVVASGSHGGSGDYCCRVIGGASGDPDYAKIWGRKTDGILGRFKADELWIVFNVWTTTEPSSYPQTIAELYCGTNQSELQLTTAGGLLWRWDDGSSTAIGAAVNDGDRHEIAVRMDNDNDGDSVSVWVDGTLYMDAVGGVGTNQYWDIYLGRTTIPGTAEDYTVYYDDIIVRDDALPTYSMANGGNGIEVLRFNWGIQTGCDTDWAGDGGNIDEDPPPSTADYVYADKDIHSVGDAETVRFDGTALDDLNSDDGIEGIAVWEYYGCQGNLFIGYGTARMKIHAGGTDAYTGAVPVNSTTYNHIQNVWWYNPDDSAEWEKADLFEVFEQGVEIVSLPILTNSNMRWATVYAFVAREVPSEAVATVWIKGGWIKGGKIAS